mgnify:CR=1 FL=1
MLNKYVYHIYLYIYNIAIKESLNLRGVEGVPALVPPPQEGGHGVNADPNRHQGEGREEYLTKDKLNFQIYSGADIAFFREAQ